MPKISNSKLYHELKAEIEKIQHQIVAVKKK